MSELVTGDAVVLELRLARPATRALALGVDLLVQAALLAGLGILIAWVLPEVSDSMTAFAIIAAMVIALVGYPTTLETLTRGKTVGKYALGLRVVSDDGGPVRFRQAFVRGMAGATLDFAMSAGVVAFTVAMLSANGKRVGDVLGGTVVIRERGPRQDGTAPQMPPELAQWARSLELSRLPDQLALSVRSYLTRYRELQPHARQTLGDQLASSVSQHVVPAPPNGTPPWAYLTAVLAERHRRAAAAASETPRTPAHPGQPAPRATPPSTASGSDPHAESASHTSRDDPSGGFAAPR